MRYTCHAKICRSLRRELFVKTFLCYTEWLRRHSKLKIYCFGPPCNNSINVVRLLIKHAYPEILKTSETFLLYWRVFFVAFCWQTATSLIIGLLNTITTYSTVFQQETVTRSPAKARFDRPYGKNGRLGGHIGETGSSQILNNIFGTQAT